jgi:hypothetical protein
MDDHPAAINERTVSPTKRSKSGNHDVEIPPPRFSRMPSERGRGSLQRREHG